MRQKYFRLKDMNEHMLKQLESGQQELDVLNSKTEGLQEVSEGWEIGNHAGGEIGLPIRETSRGHFRYNSSSPRQIGSRR